MGWALVMHPTYLARSTPCDPVLIQERDLRVAHAQGWVVVARDSDLLAAPLIDLPVQSNPRRQPDDGEDGA